MVQRVLSLQTPEEVETVYYEAFEHCDLAVMQALWWHGEVYCVHPGSGLITGRDAVMRSWSVILQSGQAPSLSYTVVHRNQAKDLAVHLVTETIGSDVSAATVLATNTYQRFDRSWFMIAHHASLVQHQRGGRALQ